MDMKKYEVTKICRKFCVKLKQIIPIECEKCIFSANLS